MRRAAKIVIITLLIKGGYQMFEKYTMASFFAGVGGLDLGFEETGRVETVYANEFDPYPVKTFNLNFATDAISDTSCIFLQKK